MNLCDANVWLALALSRHVHHKAARRWLETVTEPATILFCRATQQTLLRLLTNAAVLAPYGNPPLTNAQAWKAFEAFSADDRVALRIDEPARVQHEWKRLAARNTASPKLWMDAYLAAFAITAGLRLVTTDTAFQQFVELDRLIIR
jgi:toxin-antitoxin system PIN domain toxin